MNNGQKYGDTQKNLSQNKTEDNEEISEVTSPWTRESEKLVLSQDKIKILDHPSSKKVGIGAKDAWEITFGNSEKVHKDGNGQGCLFTGSEEIQARWYI